MSLLTLVQEVAGSLNLPQPASVVGNTDPDAILFLNLAKREGRELFRRHDWQKLIVEHTQTSLATVAQTALPTAFDHFTPDVEIWNRSTDVRYLGPVSSSEWMRLNSGISGGVSGWWRLIGGALNIYPAPTAGQTIAFEYISKNWCQSSALVGQSTWAADADTGIISEELMALGVTWRWLRAKGMDYAEEMATYERELEKAAARDRGIRIMAIGRSSDDSLPSPTWNGTIDA
jgi:hypothetical protein